MPFTPFNIFTLPEAITCSNSGGVNDDKIMRAVLGPTPETDMSKRNNSLSLRSRKPYKMYASSRIASYTYNLPEFFEDKELYVVSDIFKKYPMPLHSNITDVGVRSTTCPLIYSIRSKYVF